MQTTETEKLEVRDGLFGVGEGKINIRVDVDLPFRRELCLFEKLIIRKAAVFNMNILILSATAFIPVNEKIERWRRSKWGWGEKIEMVIGEMEVGGENDVYGVEVGGN
ncbi:Hypothetical predicted protein [Octopus vulgaris]|uniref:Uncharacterized protein n=1 Tax=Octopus vulgaris TaxID=6645 RepID=A0AA36AM81_OCTVU|nr:Hypothetical predicted protein [Octopus vulgaris]